MVKRRWNAGSPAAPGAQPKGRKEGSSPEASPVGNVTENGSPATRKKDASLI